jgi:arylsulfatase A-like enzyme
VIKGARLGKPTNLADIMPTLLFLANLPIPSDLDGKIVREAFEKIMLDSNPPVEGPPEDEIGQVGGGMSDSESEKLIDLLSGLGYLN